MDSVKTFSPRLQAFVLINHIVLNNYTGKLEVKYRKTKMFLMTSYLWFTGIKGNILFMIFFQKPLILLKPTSLNLQKKLSPLIASVPFTTLLTFEKIPCFSKLNSLTCNTRVGKSQDICQVRSTGTAACKG